MNNSEFINELKKININLNEKQIEQFQKYSNFLLEYNKNVNLTAIKDEKEVYLKHFYDSILLAKYYNFSNESILDIGAGAGFPGVPLKIVFPDIKLTSLDSNGKKTQFLEKLKNILNIDYNVVNERAEDYISENRETFDIVTGRAVTQMPILAELCIPFVKINGKFISYKGKLDSTLENGIFAIEHLGGNIDNVIKYNLPYENSERHFVIVSKKCQTDKIYPRPYSKITKKPLQK